MVATALDAHIRKFKHNCVYTQPAAKRWQLLATIGCVRKGDTYMTRSKIRTDVLIVFITDKTCDCSLSLFCRKNIVTIRILI